MWRSGHINPVILIECIGLRIAPAEVREPAIGAEAEIARSRSNERGTTHDVLNGELEPLSLCGIRQEDNERQYESTHESAPVRLFDGRANVDSEEAVWCSLI